MVSTRGVKFKFSNSEKVLCYEPDPTKAKVLYDSKVLELHVSRDDRGRKVPEYLIHFYGWSSSWDRYVKEEFILQNTEENRELQRQLATEAAMTLKGKRKGKLPPLIKETLSKKESAEDRKDPSETSKKQTDETTDTESSDEENDSVIEIEIPASLKEELENDWFYITKKDKVIKLPSEQNVISILEGYVKYLATKLLCGSTVKGEKVENETNIDNVESKLNFCKEVMDGIRVYFDFTLPHLLLYRQEKKQFYTIGNTCMPVSKIKRHVSADTIKTSPAKISTDSTESETHLSNIPKDVKVTGIHAVTRSSFKGSVPDSKIHVSNGDGETNNPKSKKDAVEGSKKHTKPKTPGSRVGLRSADKQKSEETNQNSSSTQNVVDPESDSTSSPRSESSAATNSVRGTRRSTSAMSMSPNRSTSSGPVLSPPPQKKMMIATVAGALTNQPFLNTEPTLAVCLSNLNLSPSPSSVVAVNNVPKLDKQPVQVKNSCGLLNEILSWRMLPLYLYEQIPAAPSLIYGAHHLLRLFVKLPELMYKMKMPQRKLQQLLNILDNFLQYLSEKRNEIFLPSPYIDACEDSLPDSGITNTSV